MGDIWVVNADGTGRRDLTNTASSEVAPAWSPDGSKIAFATDRSGNWEIYTMNPDGTGPTNISKNPADDGWGPEIGRRLDWSPDGKKITFPTDRKGNWELYSMNADGSGQTRLTHNSASDVIPRWSPDGSKIAFVSDRTGNWDIFTMNADGSDVTPITNDPASDIDPDWQPIPSATKTVIVSDDGFSPQSVHLRQGKTVQWNFAGTGSHSATDASGTGAFGSGAEPAGGSYAVTLFAAGTYEAGDDFTSHTGLIKVPVIVEPPSGPPGTTFTITWSSIKAPQGFVFDCQIQLPGSMNWMRLKSQQISRSRTFTPDAPGTYSFRARLRSTVTGAHTTWSPSDSIMVGSGRIAREAPE